MFDRLLAWLDAIARSSLPAHERHDAQVVLRARFGCAVVSVLVVVALLRVPMLLSRGPHAQAAVLIVCAVLALLVPSLPRVGGSFAFAAHVLVLLTLLPI